MEAEEERGGEGGAVVEAGEALVKETHDGTSVMIMFNCKVDLVVSKCYTLLLGAGLCGCMEMMLSPPWSTNP